MNTLDIVIVVIVGATFVMSLFRGIIKEVFSLGSVILGFLIANVSFGYAGELLLPFVGSGAVAKILGYAAVFIGATILIRLLGMLLEKLTKKVMLGWADHLIGSVFGFLKGCLIVSVIVLLLTSFVPKSSILRESKLTPYIISTVGLIAKASPKEIKERFAEARKKLDETWKLEKLASAMQEKRKGVMNKLKKEE